MGGSSTVNMLRNVTILFGIVVVAVGYYSFYQSSWYNRKPFKLEGRSGGNHSGRSGGNHSERQLLVGDAENPGAYRYCKHVPLMGQKCPDISLEYFYITVIIGCLVLSLGLLVISYFLELGASPFKLIDLIYHIAAAVMLLIAALCYYVSTSKIDDMLESSFIAAALAVAMGRYGNGDFLIKEKYLAATLTLIHGIIYAVLAKFIA